MPVPILTYHQIAVPPSRRIPFRSMAVHPDDFRRQMHLLKRFGFQGLSLREALPYVNGKKKGKVVAITFDDSYANVHENALPVLRDCGFTATNFVVANQIGGRNEWDIPLGVPPSACMNLAQLREWTALGNEIGSHTMDHARLPDLSAEDAWNQIFLSRVALEDTIDDEVSSFCFPYGDERSLHRQLAIEAGYSVATTTWRRRAGKCDDPFGLPRLTIRRNDSWLHFLKKCLVG
ncbi:MULTISPECIES: polysaccharide deacetylase family protein [unclassified Rhizobium]|uniref:polysaccharide deacetylase family protein n=1 Tax=unclassified Rhizobium TaxID=2613769 RepID=UPI001ADCD100|nr:MULTISPECIES: polysaccharide deacetylase family protein [unclassified Rhizobium]MBO9097336.1 polysaccharide deacetylase family protein [Rhizobium sp. L58/93]MBO9167575.1 polysaccharide deacetylase family protein [Rhizobium sp. L245/93]MBO9183534.1 polysaccharide deacetylase family protein [Rhizobium sp. E27B/91]QXZ83864.1 polysaccharide deacetylase family protein [Rhizobium sp. K1/93]QXZ88624.1 polysaccharide deacetylase family protein [Rhizobium sp. K15/93]